MTGTAAEDASAPIAPVFRPRRARIVGTAFAIVFPIALLILSVVLLVMDLATTTSAVLFVLFGLGVAWFCRRQATVSAVPTDRGLTVRNLIERRTLDWAQIVAVRFPEGDAWVRLDLDDGSTLALMAIQASDGRRALDEAKRLDALVRARGQAPDPDLGDV